MDIYDYAMKLERDGENYYRELAHRAIDAGMKNILSILAAAEVRHYNTFKKMKENEPVEVPETTSLSEVKNIFMKMRDEGTVITSDASEIDLYKRAQEIEKITRDLYREKAEKVSDPKQKEIFLKVSDEEQKHYIILDNIVDFVGRPFNWLETAEWYHLEEY